MDMPDRGSTPAGALPAIVEAGGAADLEAVRALFLDYARLLGVSLCFQGFEQELATLPGAYAPPRGRLLLARQGLAETETGAGIGAAIGVVGLRPLGEDVCEMKRLFVVPERRGSGLGRRLAEAIVAAGDTLGYRAIRLDTLSRMTAAIALYRSLGFVECPGYYPNPLPGVRYFEKHYGGADRQPGSEGR